VKKPSKTKRLAAVGAERRHALITSVSADYKSGGRGIGGFLLSDVAGCWLLVSKRHGEALSLASEATLNTHGLSGVRRKEKA
jgi:hypothetical protein